MAAVVVAAAAGVFVFSASNAAEIPKAAPPDASLVPVLTNAASPCTATPERTKTARTTPLAVEPTTPLAVKQTQSPAFQTPMSKVAPVFSFQGFPDTAKLWLNGSATVADGRLVLAFGRDKAGSAWAPTRIDSSRSFSTGFSFEITKISDGIAFVIQGRSRTSRGTSGEGLGYGARPDAGPRIQPSLAVEFDTWANKFDPVDHQHVAVTRNGDVTQHLVWKDPGFSLYGKGVVNAWIDYDARLHRLRVYVSKSGFRPAQPLITKSVDLRLIVGAGQAYVGLTGGTGITTVADPVEAVVAWNLKLR
ncbi:hypothetical protein [Micromonospora sp. NPDC000018]|uniref:lectin-like domain-containing protein n=1 Tax=Micromonospora sp. NPDC000018 TaxID=3154239 RepID=UPI00332775A0